MKSKTAQVRELLAYGEYQEALKIGKTFTRGLTKNEMAAIRLAYEVMVYQKFYLQLKVDVLDAMDVGIKTLAKRVALKEKEE